MAHDPCKTHQQSCLPLNPHPPLNSRRILPPSPPFPNPQVQLLNMEHNPDVMLLAARCLTFMADVLPTSCGSIVRHGAVQVRRSFRARARPARRPAACS